MKTEDWCQSFCDDNLIASIWGYDTGIDDRIKLSFSPDSAIRRVSQPSMDHIMTAAVTWLQCTWWLSPGYKDAMTVWDSELCCGLLSQFSRYLLTFSPLPAFCPPLLVANGKISPITVCLDDDLYFLILTSLISGNSDVMMMMMARTWLQTN